jgi:hypothetical protein
MYLNKLNFSIKLFKNTRNFKCLYSTSVNNEIITSRNESNVKLPSDKLSTKSQKLSKAMISFLERYNSHEAIINRKETEYQIGKRYLAKIMGINEDNEFDQAAIDVKKS